MKEQILLPDEIEKFKMSKSKFILFQKSIIDIENNLSAEQKESLETLSKKYTERSKKMKL